MAQSPGIGSVLGRIDALIEAPSGQPPTLVYTYFDQQTQVHILRLRFSATHFPVVLVVNVNTLETEQRKFGISTAPGGGAEALAGPK